MSSRVVLLVQPWKFLHDTRLRTFRFVRGQGQSAGTLIEREIQTNLLRLTENKKESIIIYFQQNRTSNAVQLMLSLQF